jgi:hypothetical protein
MADELRRLLDYIIDHPISHVESVEAQLDASATQDVPAEIAANLGAQKAHAGRLAPYVAKGLRMASQAPKGGPLAVEDTTSEGNMIADAFARYLVSPGLATSQSTPISSSHFRYTFEVDWPLLAAMARQAGIDLNAALGPTTRAGTRPAPTGDQPRDEQHP